MKTRSGQVVAYHDRTPDQSARRSKSSLVSEGRVASAPNSFQDGNRLDIPQVGVLTGECISLLTELLLQSRPQGRLSSPTGRKPKEKKGISTPSFLHAVLRPMPRSAFQSAFGCIDRGVQAKSLRCGLLRFSNQTPGKLRRKKKEPLRRCDMVAVRRPAALGESRIRSRPGTPASSSRQSRCSGRNRRLRWLNSHDSVWLPERVRTQPCQSRSNTHRLHFKNLGYSKRFMSENRSRINCGMSLATLAELANRYGFGEGQTYVALDDQEMDRFAYGSGAVSTGLAFFTDGTAARLQMTLLESLPQQRQSSSTSTFHKTLGGLLIPLFEQTMREVFTSSGWTTCRAIPRCSIRLGTAHNGQIP